MRIEKTAVYIYSLSNKSITGHPKQSELRNDFTGKLHSRHTWASVSKGAVICVRAVDRLHEQMHVAQMSTEIAYWLTCLTYCMCLYIALKLHSSVVTCDPYTFHMSKRVPL